MNNEIKILLEIKTCPKKYLKESKLEKLLIFMDGFVTCEYYHNQNYTSPLLFFCNFVMNKYNDFSNSLYDIIKSHSATEQDAFNLFFELLDEFIKFPDYKKCLLFYSIHNEFYNSSSLLDIKNFLDYNCNNLPDYVEFSLFICNWYNKCTSSDWADIITENSKSASDAKNTFEQLLTKFLKTNQKNIS